MNNQEVREIAKTAFKDRFSDIDIVGIDVNPAFDHYDDPLADVRIIYNAASEDLPAEDMKSVRSEIIDRVWMDTGASPNWPQVHFIAKSDLEEQTSQEMNIEDVLTQSCLWANERLSCWSTLLSDEFCKPYIFHLRRFLRLERRAGHFLDEPDRSVYPEARRVFAALEATPLSRVKVVIVGQDPYHGGQADGLAFSMLRGDKLRKNSSLGVIFRAINRDLGIDIPTDRTVHNLEGWAHQGVLLLNTVLSVRSGCAKSHYDQGWEKLTGEIIRHICTIKRNVVFLLWGEEAKKLNDKIASDRGHKVLCAPHPAWKEQEFIEAKHFSKTNRHLQDKGIENINWNLCAAVAAHPAQLTEANLDGAVLTVSLPAGTAFASGVSASSFALVASPSIAGLSISNVTGGAAGSTSAALTLATGYGFSAPSTLAVQVRAAAHSGSAHITSATLPVSPEAGGGALRHA